MNKKIIEEIERLKMMCLLDMEEPEKTDLERYEEWIEQIQCRKCSCHHYPFSYCDLCNPTEYAKYRTLRCLVEDLFYKKNRNNEKYQEHREEIKRITAEVIAMTLFVQKESEKYENRRT